LPGLMRRRSLGLLSSAALAVGVWLVAASVGHSEPVRGFAVVRGGTVRSEAATAVGEERQGQASLDRRRALTGALSGVWSATLSVTAGVAGAEAAAGQKVVVVGATGQTGRRIIERLASRGGLAVVGGVRDVAKAQKELGTSSLAVRGAMLDEVKAVDLKGADVDLKALDVVKDSVAAMAETFKGADALIIATGFVPGNPFAMNSEAHAVDNLGTIKLVDAAKMAGVRKVVLVSSILTNGRAWGQEGSAGFLVTNAFGGVLDEKIVAEKYLRASGLDYTIVRPGGLKATPPAGNLVVAKEDTLSSGEVSRDLVADVSIAAVFDPKASKRVVEIVEGEEGDAKAPKLATDQWFA